MTWDGIPLRASASAAANPPMPPPTMRTCCDFQSVMLAPPARIVEVDGFTTRLAQLVKSGDEMSLTAPSPTRVALARARVQACGEGWGGGREVARMRRPR